MDGIGSNIQHLISLDMGDMKEMAAAGTKVVFDMLPKGGLDGQVPIAKNYGILLACTEKFVQIFEIPVTVE